MFIKIDEWKNSGHTLRKFASSIGLSISAFEYQVSKSWKSLSNSPDFVELSLLVKPKIIIEATPKHSRPVGQAQILFTFREVSV